MADVTVVIPTRDRRPLLAMALRSVLGQRDVDLDCVVVDDGSTDGTAQMVAAIDDARVRAVRHDRPQGVSAARNRGAREATGGWIAFLDDDDLWGPGKLAAQLAATATLGADWAYTGAVAVDGGLRVVSAYRPAPPRALRASLPLRNGVPGGSSNVLVRRRLFSAVGGFNPQLRHLADWDLWIRLGRCALPACVDRPFVAYRLHRGNASLDTAGILSEARLIERRYGAPIDWVAIHRWIGWSALRAGQRRTASRAFMAAARHGNRSSALRAVNALLHPRAGKRLFYRPFSTDDDRPDPVWTREARDWLRWAARTNRPPHPPETIARIRRERMSPMRTQWDYLHLQGLRDLIAQAVQRLGGPDQLVLDLWCGAKPYAPLLRGRVVGVDLDLRFASADVLAGDALPFADATFDGALCTQALYLLDDPAATVAGLRRVLRPGGWVLITVPSRFRRALPTERRYTEADLRRLFEGWDEVEVAGHGGPGIAGAYVLGMLVEAAARRLRVPSSMTAPVFRLMNVVGAAVDALTAGRAQPHQLALTARRPPR